MGARVIREPQRTGSRNGAMDYGREEHEFVRVWAEPDWDTSFELLAKDTGDGYGYDYHPPEDSGFYEDVFRVYVLPFLDPDLATWSDERPGSRSSTSIRGASSRGAAPS